MRGTEQSLKVNKFKEHLDIFQLLLLLVNLKVNLLKFFSLVATTVHCNKYADYITYVCYIVHTVCTVQYSVSTGFLISSNSDSSSDPPYSATVVPQLMEWKKMFWKAIVGCILIGTFLQNTKDHVQVVW